MSELKPCPFCGENPELDISEVDLNGSATRDSFSYYCDNCDFHRGEFFDIEEAEASWNDRTDDNLTEELQAKTDFLSLKVSECDKLTERVKELKALVESSFREGYSAGYGDGNSDGQSYAGRSCRDDNGEWLNSDAKQLLEKE